MKRKQAEIDREDRRLSHHEAPKAGVIRPPVLADALPLDDRTMQI